MKKISILIFAVFLIVISSQEVYALDSSMMPKIDIIGQGAILIEEESEEVLYDKNMNQKMYPASTTKIMTAIVALEYGNLEDIVRVGTEIESIPHYSNKADLIVGEEITLHYLLYGLMLPSGNDAANTIAIHIAKKEMDNPDLSHEEAYEIFSSLMNQKADELGASNSNFKNPHGFHHVDQYTSPRDIAIIGKTAMENDMFREIVGTQELKYDESRTWENTNHLILEDNENYYPYTVGIKTGNTAASGKCLVSFATKDNLDLIAVVLKSTDEDIWQDSISLLDYGFENFEKYYLTNEGQKILTIELENGTSDDYDRLDIISDTRVETFLNKNDIGEIQEEITWNDDYFQEENNPVMRLSSTVNEGDQVGIIRYLLNGAMIGEGILVAGEGIDLQIEESQSIPWTMIYSIIIIILLASILIIRKVRKSNKESKHYN